MANITDLSKYSNSHYDPKAGIIKRVLWHYTNQLIFNNGLFPLSSVKAILLRIFGAQVGEGIIIKPSVNIKYPWLLKIGNHSWIGEHVWIDNLDYVDIGDNVCLSQGVMILTGNHDYKLETFDLIVGTITLEDGVWIGARSIVCPGVTCFSHSMLAVNSVATGDLSAYSIYQGNPAVRKQNRNLSG
jgi:putative colanic acid biosynthesis acetyltransferase WcaF